VVTLAIWLVLEGLCADLEEAIAWIKTCRPKIDPEPKYLSWAKEFIPSYRQNFREWVGVHSRAISGLPILSTIHKEVYCRCASLCSCSLPSLCAGVAR
jgi:hypothetical protein